MKTFNWKALGRRLAVMGLAAMFLAGGYEAYCHFLRPKDFLDSRYIPKEAGDFPGRASVELSIAGYKEALVEEPESPRLLTALGIAYYALGREYAVDAVNALESAKHAGALDARIFYYLGRLYSDLGLFPFASQEFEKFLRHYPGDKQGRLELAKLYYDLGSFHESAKIYEVLLGERWASKNTTVRENLVLAYFKLQDWDKVVALGTQLRGQNTEHSKELSFFLAEALRNLGRFDGALPLYEEALSAPIAKEQHLEALEGKLTCMLKLADQDPLGVKALAQELLKEDRNNTLAKTTLRKHKANAKKRT